MNTHRKLNILLTALLLGVASAASADITVSKPNAIREVPNDPYVEVEIWTDRGDGAKYCAGEPIEVFFRTNVDAWVAIYNVDTRGRISKLFPSRHARNNFVRGGVAHRLPSRYGHHFEVEGPSGWETLKAVASTDRYALSDYGWTRHRNEDRYDNNDRRVFRPASAKGHVNVAPEAIREVPDYPRHEPKVAVDETRHYVRDGYRCHVRPKRPWWYRY